MRKIIASLDVGSSYIKLTVGEMYKHKLNILACVEVPSRGVKKGFVVNPESTIESFKEVFEKGKEVLGFEIRKVIVTVPSHGAKTFYTTGTINIAHEDKTIKNKDIVRALQEATDKNVPDNAHLVCTLPTNFEINNLTKVVNPVGMIGDSLTVKAVAVLVPKKNVAPIEKCLEQIGVQVIDTTLGIIGDYYQLKDDFIDKEVGALINIGASKTEVSIFNKGILTAIDAIGIGSDHIDSDLAYYYKIDKRNAIKVKEELCICDKHISSGAESMILNTVSGDDVKISQYDASQIVISRVSEMLNLTKKQILYLTKKEISYIMVTGGTTELGEFQILLEDILGKKATIGNVEEIGARNNKYSSCAGLIKYYNSRLLLWGIDFSILDMDEEEDLGGLNTKINISEKSVLGKLFRYFFDN